MESVNTSPLAPLPPVAAATYPSLRDRAVFVTGGGSGIGAAIVTGLAEQGARVGFVDLVAEPSEALVAGLRARGLPAPWFKAVDVRDVAALQAAIAEAEAALGDFSALVNNVAHDERHRIDAVTPEYWEERMAVNQRPAFFAIQAVLPGMRRRGGGSVINLGSTGWQTKGGEYPCYAIAKSSVNGLTRGLAKPLGVDRVRINTVSPGWVMTERQIRLWLNAEGEAAIAHNQCLPDKLQPDDVARMVLFLAADDSRSCTAQEFIVDAGWA